LRNAQACDQQAGRENDLCRVWRLVHHGAVRV
jgi:hypothetical protein